MGLVISDIDQLQRYLIKISHRPDYHAFTEVVFALAGAIILFKDSYSQLEILTYGEDPAEFISLSIGGTKYILVYDYQQQTVDIKRAGIHGDIVGTFNTTTSPQKIFQMFQKLKQNNNCRNNGLNH